MANELIGDFVMLVGVRLCKRCRLVDSRYRKLLAVKTQVLSSNAY